MQEGSEQNLFPTVVPRVSSQWLSLGWSPGCPPTLHPSPASGYGSRPPPLFLCYGVFDFVPVYGRGMGCDGGGVIFLLKLMCLIFFFFPSLTCFSFYFCLPLQSQRAIANNIIIVASVLLLQHRQSLLGTREVMYIRNKV